MAHLIIKTSSLGDIVHMLPAVTDAARCIPNIEFDWVVEEGFAEVASWHPNVSNTLLVAIRRWRKQLTSKQTWQQIAALKRQLKSKHYETAIDSQGLVKSALITRWVNGEVWGYDKESITESMAAIFYQKKATVSRELHAITRNRQVLAQALNYSIDNLPLDYGIADQRFALPEGLELPENYILAFHATSREDKEWSIALWDQFIPEMEQQGCQLLFPWGNEREHQRAQQLAKTHTNATCLPQCSLQELAALIQKANAVIGMDTGLMHIAAAFNKKGIALYPVTKPALTGVLTAEPHAIESLSGEASLDTKRVSQKMLTILEKLSRF